MKKVSVFMNNIKMPFPLIIVAMSVIVFFIFIVPFIVGDFFAIDTCLDRGGRWNYDTRLCEYG